MKDKIPILMNIGSCVISPIHSKVYSSGRLTDVKYIVIRIPTNVRTLANRDKYPTNFKFPNVLDEITIGGKAMSTHICMLKS